MKEDWNVMVGEFAYLDFAQFSFGLLTKFYRANNISRFAPYTRYGAAKPAKPKLVSSGCA